LILSKKYEKDLLELLECNIELGGLEEEEDSSKVVSVHEEFR